MRHGQIKALPRELVTPVGLLMKETLVLHPCPRHPSKCELISVGTLIALMRPQIVFGMTRPLPPVWSSPRHLRPAKSFARSLPALELAGRKFGLDTSKFLRL